MHTRAVHTAMCLERKVAGRENWFQLLELLSGGFQTCHRGQIKVKMVIY